LNPGDYQPGRIYQFQHFITNQTGFDQATDASAPSFLFLINYSVVAGDQLKVQNQA